MVSEVHRWSRPQSFLSCPLRGKFSPRPFCFIGPLFLFEPLALCLCHPSLVLLSCIARHTNPADTRTRVGKLGQCQTLGMASGFRHCDQVGAAEQLPRLRPRAMISIASGSLPKRLSRHPYGAKEGNACTSALAMSGSPLPSTYSRGVAVEVYGRKA